MHRHKMTIRIALCNRSIASRDTAGQSGDRDGRCRTPRRHGVADGRALSRRSSDDRCRRARQPATLLHGCHRRWRLEDRKRGISWENISDGYFNVGTIGAIAVAESDTNVIYVGTGEKSIRGVTTSHGDGVYKSTDAGDTWTHIGLPNAGQVSRIKIHPQDHDYCLRRRAGADLGSQRGARRLRTTDGGESWEQVLSVDAQTGATDLRMDPTNPHILYASMWEHGRTPGSYCPEGEPAGFSNRPTAAIPGTS